MTYRVKYADGNLCSFGIVSAPLAAFLATDVGLGAGLAGGVATGLTGAAIGAAGGAGLGALTGSGAGKGALFGGLTGGAAGALGPALSSLGEAAGIPASISDIAGPALAGAGGGIAGAAATGQPLLTGALEGGAGGAVSGLAGLTSGATPAAAAAPGASAVPPGGVSGASASAAAPAAGPTSIAAPGSLDLTGNLLGPGTTAPAAGSGAFGSYSLTDVGPPQNIGPGTIGGGNAGGVGTPSAGGFDPSTVPAGNQDFSGGTTGTGTGLDSIVSKLTSNPSLLAGGGLLALDALKQEQPLPEQAQLNQQGATAAATGNQLASYVSSGTLPPGAQASITLATNAAKAQVRSTAASLGLSGSTWESDRMGQIDQQASAQGAQIAQQLLQQGATYSQLSSNIFNNLMQSTLAQDQQFSSALGNFAAGLAGAGLRGGATTTTTGGT